MLKEQLVPESKPTWVLAVEILQLVENTKYVDSVIGASYYTKFCSKVVSTVVASVKYIQTHVHIVLQLHVI